MYTTALQSPNTSYRRIRNTVVLDGPAISASRSEEKAEFTYLGLGLLPSDCDFEGSSRNVERDILGV